MGRINWETFTLGLSLILLTAFMWYHGVWDPNASFESYKMTLVDDDLVWYKNSQALSYIIGTSIVGLLIIVYSLQGKSITDVLKNSPFNKLISPKLIRILLWASIIIIAITTFGKFLSGS